MTNEEVLRRLHKDRELLATVELRKLEKLGIGSCRPSQGKVEGKRRLEGKNLSWLRNIRTWTGLTVEELFRIAKDREKFREFVYSVA